MATQSATGASESAKPPEAAIEQIRVVIADAEPIFRVGLRKILALEDDIRVCAQTETLAQTENAIQKHSADVLLFEASIAPRPPESISAFLQVAPQLRIVAVVSDPSEGEILEYVRIGARGVVPRSISPNLLVKCIRKVHAGETWLDNHGVNLVIEAYRSQAAKLFVPKPRMRFSPKEFAVITGVTQGLRNREIAAEIGTSEQVVKNYLRKIYDKLGVSDRLELALYCMHHKLLDSAPPAEVTHVPVAVPAIAATSAGE